MQYVKGTVVAAATLAGVAGVLVLNPTGAELAGATSTATSADAGTTPEATESTEPTEDPSPEDDESTAAAAPQSTASTATYTGEVYTTPWGPIQLEATVTDGVIVDITFISIPSDHKSAGINDRAAPQLIEEALTAQSASVDSISGATWTSEGFRYSLQSILTEAGL